MDSHELKRRLGVILAKEEGQGVDWAVVSIMSASLLRELDGSLPDFARDYLAGVNRRQSDAVFAHAQRSELLRYLRAD
jgi:hypothetical protein